jgi:hypothetical protein
LQSFEAFGSYEALAHMEACEAAQVGCGDDIRVIPCRADGPLDVGPERMCCEYASDLLIYAAHFRIGPAVMQTDQGDGRSIVNLNVIHVITPSKAVPSHRSIRPFLECDAVK